MNKETLTRAQITRLVMGSYSSRLIVTSIFYIGLLAAVLGLIVCISFVAAADKYDRAEVAMAFLPSIIGCAAVAIFVALVIVKRTQRWNVRKQEINKGEHYEVREVVLRDKQATPKAFDKCDYTLYFDGCTAYDVPDDNYAWSKDKRCKAEAMYKNAKAGDKYYALIRNESSLILGVFPQKQFEIEE